jgi:hypothetical protein
MRELQGLELAELVISIEAALLHHGAAGTPLGEEIRTLCETRLCLDRVRARHALELAKAGFELAKESRA